MPETTDDVLVIGDGPAGLSAALYLAKNGMGVQVLGQDQTPMHKAFLRNHPGTPETPGTEVLHAAREQCLAYGARLHARKATGVQCDGDIFQVPTQEGDVYRARYLVLTTGRNRHLAEALGLEETELGVRIDLNGRTSAENVYAGGNLARGITQAVISMGDGAAIALDILGREKGKPVHDYDVMPAAPPRQAKEA